MRLIDADALKEKFTSKWILDRIDQHPTADVVEVVRCKDCIWHLKDDSCARLYCITDDDFYCWHGRREDDNG